jgi:hypothetical protein
MNVMIRTVAKKMSLLAVAALFMGSVAAVSCSNKNDSAPLAADRADYGSVGLALKLANGADIASIGYKITGNGITPITGTIPLTDPTATVSVQVKGLPVGTGYIAELTAASADGKTTCGGTATFAIMSASTTSVTVHLQCRTAGVATGTVIIKGTLNNCPTLSTLIAAPATVAPGGTINLSATAADADGDALSYSWTAAGGTFGSANAASTTFKATGEQAVTITVTDGQCTDAATVAVFFNGTVSSQVCGNGIVEAGEQCDPPGATCSATCQTIVPGTGGSGAGGTGGTAAGGTGGTASGGTDGGTASGGTGGTAAGGTGGTASGGTGGTAAGGTGGTAAGGTGGTAAGGTGGTAAGGTGGTAAGGTGGTAAGGTGGSGDLSARTAACLTCEEGGVGTGDCDSNIGCSKITTGAADIALCEALDKCMRQTGCWSNNPLECLCGTAIGTACAGPGANGVCKAQVVAATKTSDPVANGTLFYSLGVPSGFATQQAACDHDICSAECKFP